MPKLFSPNRHQCFGRSFRLGSLLPLLALCIFGTFLIALLLALSPITVENCNCPVHISAIKHTQDDTRIVDKSEPKHRHKLAILVPFRDRFDELLAFAPYINDFLRKQRIHFRIFILNQVDGFRFNRASLINVGFKLSRNECDYIAMHDVDLLPLNPELSYAYPSRDVYHLASPKLHPRYHYPTFVGGILLVKREDFEKVNGMSNQYWGWGLEDDEFYVRLNQAGLNISRPINITTGTENTFKHTHDKYRRKRDMTKCFNQREVTRKRDRKTGLADIAYSIQKTRRLDIDGAEVTVVDIDLKCNKATTPWCDCGENSTKKTNATSKVVA